MAVSWIRIRKDQDLKAAEKKVRTMYSNAFVQSHQTLGSLSLAEYSGDTIPEQIVNWVASGKGSVILVETSEDFI